MSNATAFKKDLLMSLNQNWRYFLVWGIAMVILGLLAIYFTAISTIISVMLIGLLFLLAGIIVLLETAQFWWRKWGGFILHGLMGLLYLAAGIILIRGPILGAISLTFFLGVVFIALGLLRIFYALGIRSSKWGWNLLSGIISVILGGLILAGWPGTSLFILGLFVGIDLLFLGWTYIMISLAAKKI